MNQPAATLVMTAINRWLFRLRGLESGPIVLTQRRVFVLPTAAGAAYSGVVLLMLAGSINYGLSLGYLLTFLLAGLGVVAILHTFGNLARLRILPGKAEPTFVGDTARFELTLEAPRRSPRFAVSVSLQDGPEVMSDVAPDSGTRFTLEAHASRRGWQRPGRVTVATRYPLGLVHAWSYIEPDIRCLVFPAPEPDPPPLPHAAGSPGDSARAESGNDDFAGLRNHQPADSPRHIAWKAVARERPLLTKQFSGTQGAAVLLDWARTSSNLDDEARLCRLSAWVLEARKRQLSWELHLPGRDVPLGSGDAHAQACLTALALHGSKDA